MPAGCGRSHSVAFPRPAVFLARRFLTMSNYETRALAEPATIGMYGGNSKRPKIVGYAAVFNQLSQRMTDPSGRSFYEIIRRGAFARSLAGRRDIVAVFQHKQTAVLEIGRAHV